MLAKELIMSISSSWCYKKLTRACTGQRASTSSMRRCFKCKSLRKDIHSVMVSPVFVSLSFVNGVFHNVVSLKAMDNGVKKSVVAISKTWSLLWQSGVLTARPSQDSLPPSPVPWQDNSLHLEQIVSRRSKNMSVGL